MRKLCLLGALLVLSLNLFCSRAPARGKPPPETPHPSPTRLALGSLDSDLYDLARRLAGKSAELLRSPASPVTTGYEVGDVHDFWVLDLQDYRRFSVTAVLRYASPHSYIYIEEGVDVAQQDIERSANEFETSIYPTIATYFGQGQITDMDNDPRLTILNARIPGAGGYVSAHDGYPRVVSPYSNEREMIYINIGAVRMGSPGYYAILAHELQHLVHSGADSSEEGWLNEGASELAVEVCGYQPSFVKSFTSSPDTQLSSWSDQPGENGAHYGASYLFVKYLMEHYGGKVELAEMISQKGDGAQGIDDYLSQKGYETDFDAVFQDWIIANYLDDEEGSYSYPGITVRADVIETITDYAGRSGTVHQYAADYYDIRLDSPATVRFSGAPNVKLVPNEPHSGSGQWWGSRGDSLDTRLTREFDLSGLNKATLKYWLWYDIEKHWDYAYVEISEDGGRTWALLAGQHTTTQNPVGNSYGHGYTGVSGHGSQPVWVEESVDLSPYAGRKVLVRFEYVTDEAANKAGFVVDDISIPELGYSDDCETEAVWMAEGFVHLNNLVDQRFVVQIIEFAGKTEVREIPLDTEQRGEARLKGLEQGVEHNVLVVAAITPVTTEVAHYQFSLVPIGGP